MLIGGGVLPIFWVNEKIFFVNRFFYPDHSATSQLLAESRVYQKLASLIVQSLGSASYGYVARGAY